MVQSGKRAKGSALEHRIAKSRLAKDGKGDENNILDDIKRLKDEENRRKQAEYNFFRMDYMKKKESEWTAYNNKIVHAKFLSIMRKAKTIELKKDIEAMQQTHNHNTCRLDAIIQMLFRDVHEAEGQYKMALKNHGMNVDQLLEIYVKRVEGMENQFRKNLTSGKLDHDKEIREIKTIHDKQIEEMNLVLEEMEKRNRAENEQHHREFQVEKKFVVNSYSNAFQVMKIEMSKEIRQMQQQYKEENENQGKPIAHSYNEYEILRNTNDQFTNTIEEQNQQIRRNERLVALWKAKWLNNLRESQRRNTDLKKEISALKEYFHQVKRKMKKFRNGEERRLTQLVKNSRRCTKTMKDRIKFGERLISQQLLNEKHETELERLPLEIDHEQQVQHADTLKKEVTDLKKFYSKYNKVLLDKSALEEEKVSLMKQNQELRNYLKHYLDSISVNPEVMEKSNPLLIVEAINRQPIARVARV